MGNMIRLFRRNVVISSSRKEMSTKKSVKQTAAGRLRSLMTMWYQSSNTVVIEKQPAAMAALLHMMLTCRYSSRFVCHNSEPALQIIGQISQKEHAGRE